MPAALPDVVVVTVAADGQADVVPAALPDVVVVTGEKVLSPTACGRSPLAERAKKKQKPHPCGRGLFAAYLFPFRRFAVQVRNVHQLHLTDVMVTAQGIDEDAGSVHGRDGRDGQLR